MALPNNTGAFIHKGYNCTPNTIQTAQGVPYDNTSSGLSATNVQGAIDEVEDRVVTEFYGTCTTADSIATKTATLLNGQGFTLTEGVTVKIKFSYYNSASNPTLNVNSTGAIQISRAGNTSQKSWNSGDVVELTYDGTSWRINNYKDSTQINKIEQLLLSESLYNFNYPILFSTARTTSTQESYVSNAYRNNSFYIDVYSGTLKAPRLSGSIATCTGLSGASVSYSNTNSGLVATDVQSAIDEVNTTVSGITSHQQLYSYRLTNVGSNITIRMSVPVSVEFLIHIVGAVPNGGAFYDSILTGTSVSSGTATIYVRNNGSLNLGNVIITNTRIKFTVTGYTQLQIVSLHKLTNIEATVS